MSDIKFLSSSRPLFPNLFRESEEIYNVDEDICHIVSELSVDGISDPSPDLYQVEENLSDVATILDRLLSYRRELASIEAERIRLALGYQASLSIARTEADIELARPNNSDAFKSAIEARYEAVKQSIEALEQRHGLAGNPLNLTERREKLRYQMRSDVISAFKKSDAIQKGMSAIGYELKMPKPSPSEIWYAHFESANHLDDWCEWHRKISRRLETLTSKESIADLSFSLGMNYEFNAEHHHMRAANEPLVPNLLDEIANKGEFSFYLGVEDSDLPRASAFPEKLRSRSRLLALSISVAMPKEAENDWRFQASIRPPNSGSVYLSNISAMGDKPQWTFDRSFFNRNPEDVWLIKFGTLPLRNADALDMTRQTRKSWPILDVQLHLRLMVRGEV